MVQKNSLYDVIIPVAYKDTRFVWRVVKYIRQCLPETGQIYVLTARDCFKSLKNIKDPNTTLLCEDDICPNLTLYNVREYLDKAGANNIAPGWYFQQFLKFGFSLSPYAKDYYLSWDADTLPLSHIKFIENGKPQFTIKSEYNANYFKTIKRILGIDKQIDESFIAEHMLFKTEIMQQMLSSIQKSDIKGLNWIQKIINACDFSEALPAFSEFETYGSYVLAHHKDMYGVQKLNTFRYAGLIRGIYISDKLLQRLAFDLDTASFQYGTPLLFPFNIIESLWRFKVKLHKATRMGMGNTIKNCVAKIKNYKDNKSRRQQAEEQLFKIG